MPDSGREGARPPSSPRRTRDGRIATPGRLDFARDGLDWPHREASSFVEAGGIVWHVQRFGRGPACLLVHGTGAATHSWRGLAPLIAEAGFEAIAMDLPGHGFSAALPHQATLPAMARALAALVETLGLTPVLAIGHSAGAAILAEMSLEGAIAPGGLVAINGAFLPFSGIAGLVFSPLAKVLAANPLTPWFFSAGSASSRAERLIASTGSRIDAQGLDLYARLLASPGHLAGVLAMMANWDLRPLVRRLPALAPPLLLIAGENDRSVSPAEAQRVRDLIAGTPSHAAGAEHRNGPKLVFLPRLGHLAHEERPREVAGHVLRFARERGLPVG